MNAERPEEFSQRPVNKGQPVPAAQALPAEKPVPVASNQPMAPSQAHSSGPTDSNSAPGASAAKSGEATLVVRGETVKNQDGKSAGQDKEKLAQKPISDVKAKLQRRLPALVDDDDLGTQKEQVVTRDGKADLAFTGTLIASAGPSSALNGQWQEYRIYETSGGKHVFSKASRSIYLGDQDTYEAEIFDPTPASVPSKLMRSARDLTHTRPIEWTDAAVDFFGYDPLAKELYRKVSGDFEEHIT